MEGGRLLSAVAAGISRTTSPAPPPSQMAAEGPPPLSLKVMRLSRPTLAHISPHYFEASSSAPPSDALASSLVARNDGSLLHHGLTPAASLGNVDAFHPATMRDFPLSALPTLPGSFGSISLGETFAAALCLSNDSAADVSHVRLRAEMQTASAKVLLSEVTGPDETGGGVDKGRALSLSVEWELKELGLHILACEIFYFDDNLQTERSFRKVYKFQVINPLSVKTKVHIPQSANAILSPTARNLLFLELHVQNTSPLPMTFNEMRFSPAEGLTFKSMNASGAQADGRGADIWEDAVGQGPVLQPGDVRQICWIVDETDRPGATGEGGMKVAWEPGTVLPLGKMDINWTTPYGEAGHLQTSMLNRRVALPAPPPHGAQDRLVPPQLLRNPSSTLAPVHPASQPISPHPPAAPVLPPLPRVHGLNRSDSLSNLDAPRPRRLEDLGGSSMRRSGVVSLPPTPPPKDGSLEASAQHDGPPSWMGEDWDIDLTVVDRPSSSGGTQAIIEEVFTLKLRAVIKLRSGSTPPEGLAERTFELQHAAPTAAALQPMGSSVSTFTLPIQQGPSLKEWTAEYFPLRPGLASLAGLRVVAVDQREGSGQLRSEKEVGAWQSLGEVMVRR